MIVGNKITIKEIADLAGVSIATVSNVLNNKGRVSEETRQLVLEMVKKYNYTPNLSARSLKSNQSHLISVILPHLRRGELEDSPFFWQIISAIEQGAHGEKFHIILTGTPDKEDLDFVQGRNLDGVIAIGVNEDHDLFSKLHNRNIPCVFIDSHITSKPVYQVNSNDKLGGYLGTKYLASLNHEKIILVSGIKGNIEESKGVYYQRWLGYKQALEELGIDYDPSLVIGGEGTATGGYHAAQEILEKITEKTAVFALSDIAAMGLVRGLTELGVFVPDQVSIMGYDDIFHASFMFPSLTTIRQNIYLKGQQAINLLLQQIKGKEVTNKQIMLPVELVIRNSTRKRE